MAKKPEYDLQFYLDHIMDQKDEAFQKVGQAQAKVDEEEQTLAGIAVEIEALDADRKAKQKDYWDGMRKGEITAGAIQAKKYHLDALEQDYRELRRKYLAQERAVQRAKKALEKAREEFEEISNEVKAHEKLKDTKEREHRAKMRKKEERSMEEIATALHEKKRRERDR